MLFPPVEPASTSYPASERKPLLAPAVAEPWYVTKLVWKTVCAALLPIALRDLNAILDPFVAHLRRANERGTRPRQRDTIRSVLGENPG